MTENEREPKRKRGRPEKRLKIEENPEKALGKFFRANPEKGAKRPAKKN